MGSSPNKRFKTRLYIILKGGSMGLRIPDLLSIYLTLEQHRFELHGSTCMEIFFFKKYVIKYYMIHSWLNMWVWKVTVKLYTSFWLFRGSEPQGPTLIKGQLHEINQLHLKFEIICSSFLDAQRILSLFWRSLVFPRTSGTFGLYIQVFYF